MPLGVRAGANVAVSPTGIEPSGEQAYSGYSPVQLQWENSGSEDVTLVFKDGSEVLVGKNGTATRTFTASTSYSLKNDPLVTGKVVVYTPLTVTKTDYRSVTLAWGKASATTVWYYVYRDGNRVAQVTGTVYTDTGLKANEQYSYYVSACESANGCYYSTPETTAKTTSNQAPTAPGNLTGRIAGTGSVRLTWGSSTDDDGIAAYAVYVNDSLLDEVSGTTYTATNLDPAKSYIFTVRAKDTAGQLSPESSAYLFKATSAEPTVMPEEEVPMPTLMANPTEAAENLLPEGKQIDTNLRIDGQPISEKPANFTKESITVSGTAEPDVTVILTMRSKERTVVTQADSQGKWQAVFNLKDLEPGEHTLTLQYRKNGVESEPQVIARFTYKAPMSKFKLLANVSLAVIVVCFLALIAIAIKARRDRKREKLAADPATVSEQAVPVTTEPVISVASIGRKVRVPAVELIRPAHSHEVEEDGEEPVPEVDELSFG